MLTQVPAEQKSFLTFNGFFTNIIVQCRRHELKYFLSSIICESFKVLSCFDEIYNLYL